MIALHGHQNLARWTLRSNVSKHTSTNVKSTTSSEQPACIVERALRSVTQNSR